MGYDEKLTLPYDVAATQYLNFSGERMSTGRGSGIWLPELLERFDPDQIRYYGIATMPETKDTDFEWADFERRNNNELLAIYGNFVHRALTFADKNFGHEVPPATFLHATDKAMVPPVARLGIRFRRPRGTLERGPRRSPRRSEAASRQTPLRQDRPARDLRGSDGAIRRAHRSHRRCEGASQCGQVVRLAD